MKRRSMQATIDELTEAFAEDPAPVVSLEERRARKLQDQREKVAAVQRARQEDVARRDLSHRCALCGVAPTTRDGVIGQPGPVGSQSAARWTGYAKGVGYITIGYCRDCWQPISRYQSQDYLRPERMALYDRIEALDLLAYWPREGDGRSPDLCLPPLSWAGWQFRHLRGGGEGEVGDPAQPFSHLLDVRPADLDWMPPVPE